MLSPPARRLALRLGLGLAAVGLVVGILAVTVGDDAPRDDTDQLAERVDRPTVHFHVALRERVSSEGAAFGREVLSATVDRAEGDDEARAERIADALIEASRQAREGKREGADEELGPVLEAFGGGAQPAEVDRLALLLAMTASAPKENARLPEEVQLYEARRLSVEELPVDLRGLGHAARAFAFSKVGFCDLGEEAGRASDRAGTPNAAAVANALGEAAGEDAEGLADLVEGIRTLLVDGSAACCAMRQGRHAETAERLERAVSDAEALGVCEERLPILRAWAALLRGDRDAARGHADEVDVDLLTRTDFERHRMVRDAIATPGQDGASEAMLRLMDPRWLSRLVLEGTLQALGESELAPWIEQDATPQAALRFVAAEAALLRTARRLHPLFDHAYERDGVMGDLLGE
ncbi:MAG: hypothetical protein CMN31_16455 [Sandaracinus sp.]|nr:hypothetical protein [Sandaracinus sp.]